jgi:hypothetical protein
MASWILANRLRRRTISSGSSLASAVGTVRWVRGHISRLGLVSNRVVSSLNRFSSSYILSQLTVL